MSEAVDILDAAIILAQKELAELRKNTETSLAVAQEYASSRYAMVQKALDMHKEESATDFKKKLGELYALQEELIQVAEAIRTTIAEDIKVVRHANKALFSYKDSTKPELYPVLKDKTC